MQHSIQQLFEQDMCVVEFQYEKWLVGVQVAKLLGRETYNLYRSLKMNNVVLAKATLPQVQYLLQHNLVKPNTRSVTFVSFDQGCEYIRFELWKANMRERRNRCLAEATQDSHQPRGDQINENVTQKEQIIAVPEEIPMRPPVNEIATQNKDIDPKPILPRFDELLKQIFPSTENNTSESQKNIAKSY